VTRNQRTDPIALARDTRAAPRAIVIGLDCPTGLQTARLLADRGVPVIGIARDPRHACARTNVCERVIASDIGGPALIASLRRLGEELETRAVVFPCTDMSVLLTSRHRGELAEHFHLVLPDADVVEMLVDKRRFYAYAQQAGLPIPTTFFLSTRRDAERAARALRYPAVLKPAVKTPEWERNTRAKVYRVAGSDELLAIYDQCSTWSESLVVQEWIDGGDTDHFTCNAYFGADYEPRATLTTRKLRQWPPTGGQACLSVEVRDDVVVGTTVDLFRRVRHRGLGYLELKREPGSGRYLIIEPNVGRPTGRSATAEAVGVEMLYTMYCDALGWPLPAARSQAFRGVKWIYLRRDVQAAVYRWVHGDLTLGEWAESWRGPKLEALFSWRDPMPFWMDIGRTVTTTAARLMKSVRRDRTLQPVRRPARGAAP
jgi:predicted ATP-grasp superfamily ATP-dependent carboligase